MIMVALGGLVLAVGIVFLPLLVAYLLVEGDKKRNNGVGTMDAGRVWGIAILVQILFLAVGGVWASLAQP